MPLGKHGMESTAKIAGIPIGGKQESKKGLTPLQAITKQRGHPYRIEGLLPGAKLLFPTLHPAYAGRSAKHLTHVIREDIVRAAKIAAVGGDFELDEPPFVICDTIKKIAWLLKRLRHRSRARPQITVDIETDDKDRNTCRIRCIGLGIKLEKPMKVMGKKTSYLVGVIPIRSRRGGMVWSKRAHERIRKAIHGLLDRDRVEYHYGHFDSTVLLRERYITNIHRPYDCTAIRHSDTRECDAPHGVDYVSSRLDPPPFLWKGDVDHKAPDADDWDLWVYNARDVFYQILIGEMLDEWLIRDGTTSQYRVDKAMTAGVRNMSNLGFCIHEPTRQVFHEYLQEKIQGYEEKLIEIVGPGYNRKRDKKKPEFNPGSWQQVGRYLFYDKGYTPLQNVKGFPPADAEDWSTSTPALIALLDDGVDQETDRFINNLLFYRAHEKLDSTYVRGLPVRRRKDLPSWLRHCRTTFNQHTVPSGRLASSEPVNFLNWPKIGILNLRSMVWAPPGHVFVCADFEQLELRLWAIAIQDAAFMKAFADGKDAHAINVAYMFSQLGSSIDEIYSHIVAMKNGTWKGRWKGEKLNEQKQYELRDYLRLCAKKFQFSKQYGADWLKIWKVMVAERDKATGKRTFKRLEKKLTQLWDSGWDKAHPNSEPWAAKIDQHVWEHGYVGEPLHGRLRHFPGGPNKIFAPRNHRIQAEAGAIANTAFLRILRRIPFQSWSPWTGLWNFVYDELCACVPEDRADETVEIFNEAMRFNNYQGSGVDIYGEAEIERIWTGDKPLKAAEGVQLLCAA
jgi:DNA polymerase I-like protein with 3'-5' exonuclease and polymerase domains